MPFQLAPLIFRILTQSQTEINCDFKTIEHRLFTAVLYHFFSNGFDEMQRTAEKKRLKETASKLLHDRLGELGLTLGPDLFTDIEKR